MAEVLEAFDAGGDDDEDVGVLSRRGGAFASPEAPAALREAFAELREAVLPLAGDDDLETLTETVWSGLHGLVTLMRNGRLRHDEHERRLALLIRHFSN